MQYIQCSHLTFVCLQREIELSKQHHAGDLQEKNRLSRMLEHKVCMLPVVKPLCYSTACFCLVYLTCNAVLIQNWLSNSITVNDLLPYRSMNFCLLFTSVCYIWNALTSDMRCKQTNLMRNFFRLHLLIPKFEVFSVFHFSCLTDNSHSLSLPFLFLISCFAVAECFPGEDSPTS